MDFDAFIARAWQDHDTFGPEVSERLAGEGASLVADEGQWLRLAHLTHHLHGEHLRDLPAGLAALDRLALSPYHRAESESGAALGRYRASLRLAGDPGELGLLGGHDASSRIRILAQAAAALGAKDVGRAHGLLTRAAEETAPGSLPASDPAHRTLAVIANNLAVVLEDHAATSAEHRALMLEAAHTARRQWQIAGGWLETERADYRLAISWLAAGDPVEARSHALACRAIVDANGSLPLEVFYASEALARTEAALGNGADAATAVDAARSAFARLEPEDQAWCRPSLDRIGG